ncbi:MFS transporter [Streptomyces roseirectus]|uniref:MFS transporter n=1 Tax=Streptomyces roseirectus TaxID=2768066 RepID=A0A7H0IIT1_9ACTN|nr:MFS transporter [Streptomyces roseirectus]QNP72697.1 MFS transporter [Streptomyces roseirectus]
MSANPSTDTGTWPAVLALAAATFAVVTTEMLPVGLLTSLGASLGVSAGTAGLAVTLPGLVAAGTAPLLPVVVRRSDRRHVLVALLLLLAVAGLLSALTPGLAVLLVARALVGVCIGGVWAIAAGLPARLVPGERAGRATAVVFSGIAVASVIGVPAGTFLGEAAGWRWAFAAPAFLATAVAAALYATLPPLPAETPVRLTVFPQLLRDARLRRGLTAVALLVTGHFAAYTYVRPLLERVPGLAEGQIGLLLLAYGTSGVAGTFLIGTRAPRNPTRTLLLIATTLTTTLTLLAPSSHSLPLTTTLLLLWGLLYGGVSVTAQTWLTSAAPHTKEAASALFAGVFNAAIAAGAFAGGRTADTHGPTAVLYLGATLTLLAAPTLLTATRRRDLAGNPEHRARA